MKIYEDDIHACVVVYKHSPSDVEIRHSFDRAQRHLDNAHLQGFVLFQLELVAKLLPLALDRGDVCRQRGRFI